MTKDYIKFRNTVKKDKNLSLEESYFLELIFDYHNTYLKYAYPSYETLMSDLKTNRRAKVSKLIKSLVKKGYIQVNKVNRHNTYRLLKYLFIHENKPKDSDGKTPLDGQVHFTELTPEEKEVIDSTNFSQNQIKTLLQLSKNKLDKVLSMIKYVSNKANIANKFGYIKALLERGINIDDTKQNYHKKSIGFVDNCSNREYSEEWYKSTEQRLLGWT